MRGGKRSGAGRKAGARNKRTAAVIEKAAESGLMPLDYMLGRMRDPQVEYPQRDDMAKAAAPYLHPRLAAIEHTGKDGAAIQIEDTSPLELARRVAFLLSAGLPK